MIRNLLGVVTVLVAAAATTSAVAEPAFGAPNEICGVKVNFPHPSDTTPAQIHTRVVSFCKVLSVQSNQVSATTYRNRWYGLERLGGRDGGPKATDNLRITVAVDCVPGEQYRYRTEARGRAVIAGETYTASVYEENNTEITCKP